MGYGTYIPDTYIYEVNKTAAAWWRYHQELC